MLHIDRWKIILTIILTVLGIAYAVPSVLPEAKQEWLEQHVSSLLPSHSVNLGLDLRGGSHLLLQADTAAALRERLEFMVDAARTELRGQNIAYTALASDDNGIHFKIRYPQEDREAARKVARKLADQPVIDIKDDGMIYVTLDEKAIRDIKTQVVNQSIEIVRRRVDESGTKEPVIQRQGIDRIVLQLPGVDDPAHVKELIGRTAKMTFHLLDEEAGLSSPPGPGSRRLPLREDKTRSIIIKKRVMLSGEMLVDAQPTFDQSGPVVSFKFNAVGGRRFCEITKENVGKPFAIVLDDEVISYPVIRDAICGGSGQISGGFSVKEATDLALLLRAGALPAPLSVVEERTVGPTLGSDSIAAGKTAAIIAFIAVFTLMAASYGLFGFFANIALALNIVFIFAVLSILQATLTLPGIAAIILTIGIAVDSNVLIYERIREELRNGRSVLSAVDTGYREALRTIFDSNLTTLIVALILFSFGSGPVKGFAVAMSVGIITSLFSSIMITRLLVVAWLRKKKPSSLAL